MLILTFGRSFVSNYPSQASLIQATHICPVACLMPVTSLPSLLELYVMMQTCLPCVDSEMGATRRCPSSPPAVAFKAQALNRLEGIHPDGSSIPSSSTTGNNSSFGDLFTTTTTSGGGTTTTMSPHHHQQHHGFDLPDPFRKFPSSVSVAAAANVEFSDELSMATLLGGQGDH